MCNAINFKKKLLKTIIAALMLIGLKSTAWAFDAGDIKYLFSIYGAGMDDKLKQPHHVFVDKRRAEIYVINGDESIMIFNMYGSLLYKFGREQGITFPQSLVVDSRGRIYISRGMAGDILVCNYRGKIDHRYRFTGVVSPVYPWQMAIDEKDNLYVVDQKTKRVLVFNNREELKFQIGEKAGRFSTIAAITVDERGRIYIINGTTSKISVFDSLGKFLFDFGQRGGGTGKMSGPVGIAVDSAGRIFVLDTNRQKIIVYDKEGRFKFEFGELGFGELKFLYPSDIVLDAGGRIYVADSLNNRIEVLKAGL